MLYEDFKQLKVDRQIHAIIGISRKQFDDLVPHFVNAHQEIQNERLAKGEIKRLPTGGKKGPLSDYENQLFFILYYLKNYPTFDVIGFLFHLSAGHAHDKAIYCMNILERALKNVNVLPKQMIKNIQEFKELVKDEEKIIIDGVECACVRPQDKDKQKEYYSGKKKRHTVKTLIATTTQRYILYVSLLFGGSNHDYGMMKKLFNPNEPWFYEVRLELDLGFVGAPKDYNSNTIILPYKKPRRSKKNPDPKLTNEQLTANKIHASSRVRVEHAIGGMKQFFCLTHRIRAQSTDVMNKYVLLSAGLWNYKISSKLTC
jgi:hypothetical protein